MKLSKDLIDQSVFYKLLKYNTVEKIRVQENSGDCRNYRLLIQWNNYKLAVNCQSIISNKEML